MKIVAAVFWPLVLVAASLSRVDGSSIQDTTENESVVGNDPKTMLRGFSDTNLYDDDDPGMLDQWRVDLETTQARYWHRMHRALKENGTFHMPDQEELAELIVEEVGMEEVENGTADARMAMTKVAEKILAQAAGKGNASLTEEEMEELTELFDFPDNSPELEKVDMAVMTATNQSECLLPGHCSSTQYASKVKDFVKQMCNDYIKEGKEPDIDEIYERLETEMGLEAEQVNTLIESSPKIRKYLKKKMKTTGKKVLKKQFGPLADQVEKALIDGGNNMTDLDDTMKDLKMDDEELAQLLFAMGTTRSKKVLEAVAKPQKEMEERVKRGYEELAKENPDNHTHFEEIEEIDEVTGQRKLQFVRHPSKISMEDHIKAVDDRLHRRRLARNARPKDTSDFEGRLSGHIEELQGHIRHLQLACTSGTTAARCAADGLEDVASDLSSMGGKVFNELNPLNFLLEQLDKGQNEMDKAERLANNIGKAIDLATNIPGVVGKFFLPVKTGMKVPLATLRTVDSKATQFENSVGKLWQNSVGRIDGIIGSFDSDAFYYVITGATAVATIQESACATSLIDELSGANLIGGIERAVHFVKDYINVLFNALKALKNTLESTAWKGISSILNGIVEAIEPVKKFFTPFEPLSKLIQTKVEIRPWFKLPYTISRLGWNTCDRRYHKGMLDKRTCFEDNSRDWTYHILQNKMRKTCAGGRLSTHWSGECKNKGYGRHKVGWKLRCRWIRKWWGGYPSCSWKCDRGGYSWCYWDPFRCIVGCKGGYSGFLNTCYKNNCPRGYGNVWGKALCTRQIKRSQKSRKTKCDQYRLKKNTRYKQDIFGTCWQSCGHGHSEFLGACFAPAVLKISIQDIFDALAKILKFIVDLPIVSTIMGFIDRVVETLLKPVMGAVSEWLKDIFSLPTFPSIGLDFLPFDAFNKIDINMPKPPDISAITDMPSKLFNNVIKALPASLPSLGNCGTDFDCILKTIGMGDMVNFFGHIADVLDQFKIGDLLEQIEDIVTGVKCLAWKTQTVPVSNLLTEIGLPDINACDIELKYCDELDLSAIEPTLAMLDEMFEDIIGILQMGESGRRLAITKKMDAFWPIFGLKLPRGGEAPPIGYVLDYFSEDKQVTRSETRKGHPMGYHINFDFTAAINLGLIRRHGKFKLGLEFGFGTKLTLGHVSGPQAMLRKSIDFLEKIQEFDVDKLKDEGGAEIACKNKKKPRAGRVRANSIACAGVAKVRKIMSQEVPKGCKQGGLEDLYERHGKKEHPDFSNSAVLCVKHWYDTWNKFEKAKGKAQAAFTALEPNAPRVFPSIQKGVKLLLKSQLHTQFLIMRTDLANSVVNGTPPFLAIGKDGGNPAIDMVQINVGLDLANGFGPFVQFGNFKHRWTEKEGWTFGGGLLSFHAGSFTIENLLKLLPAARDKIGRLFGKLPDPPGATEAEAVARARRIAAEEDTKVAKGLSKKAKKKLQAKVADAAKKQEALEQANHKLELYGSEGTTGSEGKRIDALDKANRDREEGRKKQLEDEERDLNIDIEKKRKFLAKQDKIKEKAEYLGDKTPEGERYDKIRQRRQVKFVLEEMLKKKVLLQKKVDYNTRQEEATIQAKNERSKFEENSAPYGKAKRAATTAAAKAREAKNTAEKEEKTAAKEVKRKQAAVRTKVRTETNAKGEEAKGTMTGWYNAEKSITVEAVFAFVLDPQCIFQGCGPVQKETKCSASGDLELLDKHSVNCGTGFAMSKWQVKACDKRGARASTFKITYTCWPIDSIASVDPRKTSCGESIGRKDQYLDRFNVTCGEGQVMQNWRFDSNGGCSNNDAHFSYDCANVQGYSKCTDHQTQCNAIVGRDTNYLDRHDLVCNTDGGSVLKGFKMATSDCEDGDQKFLYTCCDQP